MQIRIEVFLVHGEKESGGGPEDGCGEGDFREEREVCVLELGRAASLPSSSGDFSMRGGAWSSELE